MRGVKRRWLEIYRGFFGFVLCGRAKPENRSIHTGGDGLSENYIKLNRKILEWEWYCDPNTCRIFIHMLLKANWKAGRFMGVEVPAGAFVSSLETLARELNLTKQNVRTAVRHLKETGELTCSQHGKFTVFTVKNYGKYQGANTQLTRNQHAANTQLTPIEEGKKERIKENNNIYTGPPEAAPVHENSPKLFEHPCREACEDSQETPEYPYREVIGYLNEKAGTAYKYTSRDSKKHMKARFSEGYTLLDFKTVVDKKTADWKGGENAKYLRPSTLFGPKFEGYLNQPEPATKGNRFSEYPTRGYDFEAIKRGMFEQ